MSLEFVLQEGSEGEDILFSSEPVGDGVVGCGFFSGTWNGVTTQGGRDVAVAKLFSNGTVAWRWQVRRSDSRGGCKIACYIQ